MNLVLKWCGEIDNVLGCVTKRATVPTMVVAGVATTLCAILSGVDSTELEPEEDKGYLTMMDNYWQVPDFYEPGHRMLYVVNTTDSTGLNEGVIIGISIGAALLVLLLLSGFVWCWYSRSRPVDGGAAYTPAFSPMPELNLPESGGGGGGGASIFANLAGADELSTVGMNQPARSAHEELVSGIPLLALGQKHVRS